MRLWSGRGYSFEAIRAKVLLTGGLRKEARPKYGESSHHATSNSERTSLL